MKEKIKRLKRRWRKLRNNHRQERRSCARCRVAVLNDIGVWESRKCM